VDFYAVPLVRPLVGALGLVCSLTENEGAHMVKVSVLYPNRADTKFDMTYYLNQHIPTVRQLLGSALKGVSVEQGISGEEPGSPAPYVTTCHLLFDSVQAFQTSFSPHAQEIMEDIPKYTNSEPLIQIGEVKL
jgi:uncharacterized protein (TIGR02118 family)